MLPESEVIFFLIQIDTNFFFSVSPQKQDGRRLTFTKCRKNSNLICSIFLKKIFRVQMMPWIIKPFFENTKKIKNPKQCSMTFEKEG